MTDTHEDPMPSLRKPKWAQLYHLITGARERGFTPEQCAYLESCIGIAFVKGVAAGLKSKEAGE